MAMLQAENHVWYHVEEVFYVDSGIAQLCKRHPICRHAIVGASG